MAEAPRRVPAVVPMVSYEDVATAADWLAAAFGFEEAGRWAGPDGRVMHVNLVAGDGLVMLGFPGADYESPRHHAETCAAAREWARTPFVVDGVLVYVSDLSAHLERARAAGATVLSELEENPDVGQRQYRCADPEGHRWMFAELLDGPPS